MLSIPKNAVEQQDYLMSIDSESLPKSFGWRVFDLVHA
jgi:hypothetical protein